MGLPWTIKQTSKDLKQKKKETRVKSHRCWSFESDEDEFEEIIGEGSKYKLVRSTDRYLASSNAKKVNLECTIAQNLFSSFDGQHIIGKWNYNPMQLMPCNFKKSRYLWNKPNQC